MSWGEGVGPGTICGWGEKGDWSIWNWKRLNAIPTSTLTTETSARTTLHPFQPTGPVQPPPPHPRP